MKEGWTYKKLGELYPIIMGKTPPRNVASYWDTKKETHNLWVSIADLSKNEGKEILDTKEYISDEAIGNITKVNKGSLLVSFKLTLGKMAFAGDDLYTNEAIMSLGKREDIELKYLYYYFSSLDWGLLASGNEKIKGKTLNKKSLSEIPVAYLPLTEQQRIVARLDSAFAHIDELKANAEKQLSEAKALFQKALAKAMEPKEGWKEKKLEGLCTAIVDCPHSTPRKVNHPTKYPCIRTSELKGGKIEWESMQYLDEDEYIVRTARIKPQPNDIVYGREGTYGDAVLLPEGYYFSLGQRTMLFRPDVDSVMPQYLHYYVISSHVYEQAKAKNSGCGVGHVNVKDIKQFDICIPKSLSEQRRIVERLDALSENVRKLEDVQKQVLTECDALKQAMLREIFE